MASVSPTQALDKVRVRVDAVDDVDDRSYHLMDDGWLITAKPFPIECTFAPAIPLTK